MATKQYVHHIVVYLCGPDINETYSVDCDADSNRQVLNSCHSGEVISAWAVGGEVSQYSICFILHL